MQLRGEWNREVFGVELREVEPRGFRCGAKGVLVLNRGVFGVELRDFGC